MSRTSADNSKEREEIEIVSRNIVPELYDYINSSKFRLSISDFLSKYTEDLDGLDQSDEYTHKHKKVFDLYQDHLDTLFEEFAEAKSCPLKEIYQCCRDIGE